MADSAYAVPSSTRRQTTSAPLPATALPRHSILVRVTHWLTALSFFALLLTGVEILISHPRFYWGEAGNDLTTPLFRIPIPASRSLVPTGYGYVLPDQNGWSRALHFQAAWLLVFTAFFYVLGGLLSGHFRRHLLPTLNSAAWLAAIRAHLSFRRPPPSEHWTYNPLQRLSYLVVVFGLFPLAIWTGLAMSPAFVSAFPLSVTILGGQQSARTIHFFDAIALTLFVLVHVAMVVRAGLVSRMRAMILGNPSPEISTLHDGGLRP